MSCTGVPDLKLKPCCEWHDKMYGRGGTSYDRYRIDRGFYRCMKRKGSKFVCHVYYHGVRLWGWLFFRYGGNASYYERFKKWLH